MTHFRISLGLSVFIFTLMGCGSSGDNKDANTTVLPQSQESAFLSPYEIPLWFAFDRDPNIATEIIPSNRRLDPGLFEAMSNSELNASEDRVESLITGFAVSAVDSSADKRALDVELAILARKYDPVTRTFSNETRYFYSDTDLDLSVGQKIQLNAESPVFGLSGLGLRLYNGEITLLQVQRTTLAQLGQKAVGSGVFSSSAGASVTVDPGWFAVGIYARFKPILGLKDADGNPIVVETGPFFLNDVYFEVGQLKTTD